MKYNKNLIIFSGADFRNRVTEPQRRVLKISEIKIRLIKIV